MPADIVGLIFRSLVVPRPARAEPIYHYRLIDDNELEFADAAGEDNEYHRYRHELDELEEHMTEEEKEERCFRFDPPVLSFLHLRYGWSLEQRKRERGFL